MATAGEVKALKEFFSVAGRPVTNAELIDFHKGDPEGYKELLGLVQQAK